MAIPHVVGNIANAYVSKAERDAWNAFTDYIDDFVTRYNATLAKLDLDGGVIDTDYAATNPAPVRASYWVKS